MRRISNRIIYTITTSIVIYVLREILSGSSSDFSSFDLSKYVSLSVESTSHFLLGILLVVSIPPVD